MPFEKEPYRAVGGTLAGASAAGAAAAAKQGGNRPGKEHPPESHLAPPKTNRRREVASPRTADASSRATGRRKLRVDRPERSRIWTVGSMCMSVGCGEGRKLGLRLTAVGEIIYVHTAMKIPACLCKSCHRESAARRAHER